MTSQKVETMEMFLSAAEDIIQFKGLPLMDDGNPPAMQILINQEKKILFLHPCTVEEKDAVKPVPSKDDPNVYTVDNCGLFLTRLYAIMSWDLFKDYRLLAVFSTALFDSGWLVDLSQKQEMPNRKLFPNLSGKCAQPEWPERTVSL